KMLPIAGDWTEIKAAIPQRGFLGSQLGKSADLLVIEAVFVKTRSAPQGFTNGRIAPCPMQSLLGSIVQARNPSETVDGREPKSYLIIESMLVAGLHESDALLHIVVVQERDEEASGVAVRTEHIFFDALPKLVHPHQIRRRRETLHHRFQLKEQRK